MTHTQQTSSRVGLDRSIAAAGPAEAMPEVQGLDLAFVSESRCLTRGATPPKNDSTKLYWQSLALTPQNRFASPVWSVVGFGEATLAHQQLSLITAMKCAHWQRLMIGSRQVETSELRADPHQQAWC